MTKLLSIVGTAVLCLALAAANGSADPIQINGINPPAYTLIKEADLSLEIVGVNFGAAATYQADSGTVSFGTADFFTGVPANIGGVDNYTASGTQSVSYQSAADVPATDPTDTLLATITWTKVVQGGEWEFTGTAAITFSSGDPAFLADFPAGSVGEAMARMPVVGCNLSTTPVCQLGNMTVLLFEGGDLTPGGGVITSHGIDLPEPGSLILLATALGAFWAWRTRIKRPLISSAS